MDDDNNRRRTYGEHLTSEEIFNSYIFPEIKDKLNEYLWMDLYCGEGNLIFPILESIPSEKVTEFFTKKIFLSDIQQEMVDKCLDRASSYNIPEDIARTNILKRDNLSSFPAFLSKNKLPIYHITNPPYLYLGYIRKHKETQKYFKYFEEDNVGYQDLYQIAMINDLRNNVNDLIYIIPSNFLFGASVSNKFRSDFLNYYDIQKTYIFEKKIFEFTGTNILIGVFSRKKLPNREPVIFEGKKILKKNHSINRYYTLKPEYQYRAGYEFDEFTAQYKNPECLNVSYYLLKKDVEENRGKLKITVIDTSNYQSNKYTNLELSVNNDLKNRVQSNILYVKTVDSGSYEGRAGLYEIMKDFGVNGIYVSRNTYRTSPIQIFLEPILSIENQLLLREYFNVLLEHFRDILDSEFLTTYKYSNADYTRKYLGLTQVRKLIETFPLHLIHSNKKGQFISTIKAKDPQLILKILAQ